jgi:hypothetical protein
MIARNVTLVLLVATLAGCMTVTVSKDASKWTIEVASSEILPSGPCRIYDERNNLMFEGTLLAGKMDSTWTGFGSGGDRLAVLSYRDGRRSGPVKMWFGPLAYPQARGRVKLEGVFLDGDYDGTVTRYYPSGAKECVRVYEHGALKTAQFWSPDGIEMSGNSAMTEAASELKADLTYLALIDDMVARSLAQAHRIVRP